MKPIPITGRHDDRLRVLEVIGNASMGGMENYIQNFITHLPSEQFQITCICPYESPFTAKLRELGVEEVYITPIEDDPVWRSVQLAVEVARLHEIDIFHAHMPKAHVLAGLAGCLLHKPVVATIHGMNVTSHELGITRAVGSHVITNCQEAFTQALAMGVTPDKLALIRNGVDVSRFNPNISGEKLRKAINVPEGTPLVGFVGRLDQEKGPDLFMRAAEYVHQHRPDVQFVVVGEGRMRKQLLNMCEHFGMNDKVHFLGWWEDTQDVYRDLDILVHTSRSDGTSLVLLEAMACARPTVGIAVGGVREIIENEKTGLMAGAGDWEGIGRHLLTLLEEPERMLEMGTAARKRVEQNFNVETNTRRCAEILRQKALSGVNSQRVVTTGMVGREISDQAAR